MIHSNKGFFGRASLVTQTTLFASTRKIKDSRVHIKNICVDSGLLTRSYGRKLRIEPHDALVSRIRVYHPIRAYICTKHYYHRSNGSSHLLSKRVNCKIARRANKTFSWTGFFISDRSKAPIVLLHKPTLALTLTNSATTEFLDYNQNCIDDLASVFPLLLSIFSRINTRAYNHEIQATSSTFPNFLHWLLRGNGFRQLLNSINFKTIIYINPIY